MYALARFGIEDHTYDTDRQSWSGISRSASNLVGDSRTLYRIWGACVG